MNPWSRSDNFFALGGVFSLNFLSVRTFLVEKAGKATVNWTFGKEGV